MSYTVTLELPECAEGGGSPTEAVESFIAQATGMAHIWVYQVEDNVTGQKFQVDMAALDGKKVTELHP